MIQFGILFATQILEGVLIILLLARLQGMKKQIDHIIKEVKGYIAFITEDADRDWEDEALNGSENCKNEGVYSSERRSRRREENIQSQLIQDVLQEYFP